MKYIWLSIIIGTCIHAIDNKVDKKSQLMWQNNAVISENKKDFESANTFCNTLVLSSYNDWRLPTIKELQTLIDTKNKKPAIKVGFSHTISSYYWSSTPRLNDAYNAWLVNFEYGYTDYSSTSGRNYVRCVRVYTTG